jgi:hypothetical protein
MYLRTFPLSIPGPGSARPFFTDDKLILYGAACVSCSIFFFLQPLYVDVNVARRLRAVMTSGPSRTVAQGHATPTQLGMVLIRKHRTTEQVLQEQESAKITSTDTSSG